MAATLPTSSSVPSPSRRPANLLTLWGVLGPMALLSTGVWRVLPHAIEPWLTPGSLSALHIALFAASVGSNAWTEGYRAFQKMIAPRVLARAQWLTDNPERVHPLLAPIFVAGFFAMQKRAIIVRYVFLVVIICVIIGMKFMPQPWRGIIDAGVAVGLGWGVIAMGVGLIQLFRGVVPDADPQLPDAWVIKDGNEASTHSRA